MRQRILLLHTAARRAELHSDRRSSPTAPRSTSIAGASESTSDSTIPRSSPPRSANCTGTRRSSAGGSAPTATTTSGPGSWSWPRGRFTGRSCPASRGSRISRGTAFHSSRWDYEYTGGDSTGGLDKLERQTRRGRGHRGDRRADRAVPGPVCQAPLRLSAHAVVGRRAQQHADRSRMGEIAEAGLAEGTAAQLSLPGPSKEWRWASPIYVCDFWTELGRNTAARVLALQDPASMTPEQFMDIREEEDYKVMERLRRRVEEHRRRPRDRRGAQALLPVPVQAAVHQRRLPSDLQPPERDAGRRVWHEGRGAGHGKGLGRQRHRVRSRLHHLRQRI